MVPVVPVWPWPAVPAVPVVPAVLRQRYVMSYRPGMEHTLSVHSGSSSARLRVACSSAGCLAVAFTFALALAFALSCGTCSSGGTCGGRGGVVATLKLLARHVVEVRRIAAYSDTSTVGSCSSCRACGTLHTLSVHFVA